MRPLGDKRGAVRPMFKINTLALPAVNTTDGELKNIDENVHAKIHICPKVFYSNKIPLHV